MSLPYRSAVFRMNRNPLWGSEHFPKAYLHAQRFALLDEISIDIHSMSRLHILCDATSYILGLFYKDWSLVINYEEANCIFLEKLMPAKGGGGIFIAIQFDADTTQPSPLLLSLEYDTKFHTIYDDIAKTISSFTKLPLQELDLGFDV